MYLPTIYYGVDSRRAKDDMANFIKKMYLYRNGTQLLVETYDGVQHKLNIVDSDHSSISEW